jgi:hypothetical protein
VTTSGRSATNGRHWGTSFPQPLNRFGWPADSRSTPCTKEVIIDGLSVAIAIYAGCVALLAAIGFALRRPRSPLLDKLVLALEGALVVRAMLGVGAMVSGAHPYPGVTHVAYLLTSVGLLPVMVATLADDRSHWSTAVVGVACLALVVIAIRIEMTWSGHA